MTEESRQCYICLEIEGEEDDWVSPCRCSGTLKWVHRHCLIRWVRELEANRPWTPASCPQCTTQLRLIPKKGAIVMILEFIDTAIYPACKYMAAWFFGIIAFDAACSALGIIAQSQVYGLEETLLQVSKLGKMESVIRLHFTAISLVFVNSISWERSLLEVLRGLSKLPTGIGRLLPEEVPARFKLPEQSSLARIAINSALLPFIAKWIGKICFSFLDNNLDRVLLGGLSFLVVKGACFIYLLHNLEIRRKKMIITPYQPNP